GRAGGRQDGDAGPGEAAGQSADETRAARPAGRGAPGADGGLPRRVERRTDERGGCPRGAPDQARRGRRGRFFNTVGDRNNGDADVEQRRHHRSHRQPVGGRARRADREVQGEVRRDHRRAGGGGARGGGGGRRRGGRARGRGEDRVHGHPEGRWGEEDP